MVSPKMATNPASHGLATNRVWLILRGPSPTTPGNVLTGQFWPIFGTIMTHLTEEGQGPKNPGSAHSNHMISVWEGVLSRSGNRKRGITDYKKWRMATALSHTTWKWKAKSLNPGLPPKPVLVIPRPTTRASLGSVSEMQSLGHLWNYWICLPLQRAEGDLCPCQVRGAFFNHENTIFLLIFSLSFLY